MKVLILANGRKRFKYKIGTFVESIDDPGIFGIIIHRKFDKIYNSNLYTIIFPKADEMIDVVQYNDEMLEDEIQEYLKILYEPK